MLGSDALLRMQRGELPAASLPVDLSRYVC